MSVSSPSHAQESKNPRLLLFILAGFCILFIISYSSRLIEKVRAQNEIQLWEERIIQAKERQAVLFAELDYVNSDEYIAKVARDELGMSLLGDKVIVVLPQPAVKSDSEAVIQPLSRIQPQGDVATNWQQWWSVFMGQTN